MHMSSIQIFICFAAEDRYTIAEPLVYHLKNYGIPVWYDRHSLVMGDNRQEKNLDEGAAKCIYAIAVLSENTNESPCAMEELSILENRYRCGNITVFPILYDISPNKIPNKLNWVKELIFKEVNKNSGTRELCNHIACKITSDLLSTGKYKNICEIISSNILSDSTQAIFKSYICVDYANLNSRVALLYAAYLTITHSKIIVSNPIINMINMIFNRLFTETRLNLLIDYREIWLLENAICVLVNSYFDSSTDSKI